MSERRGLFDHVLARGGAFDATTDEAWLRALLDAEAGLAWALADVGRIPVDAAEAIGRACRTERFDVAALGRDAAQGGNPVIPLVEALGAAVGPAVAPAVHAGATSQDIMDTATMLVAGRAVDAIAADLELGTDRAAALAAEHRATPMAGRTLLQVAVPTTFGLVAATWVLGLDEAAAALGRVRNERRAVQLGGAAGTLSAYGAD